MNKAQKWLWNSKKSEQEFEVQYWQHGGLGRCSSLLVYDHFEAHVAEDVKVIRIRKRKLRFSTNSSKIDLRSLTHSVPWVIKELEAVDSRQYQWFYRGWPPKESIGRTDLFMASVLSVISEEMIKSLFLRYFSVTTFSVFCLLFFVFFFKEQSKIGVRIIHRSALYTGKYGVHLRRPWTSTFFGPLHRPLVLVCSSKILVTW